MFTYLVIVGAYGTLAVTMLYAVLGGWSGIASLGNACALLIGVNKRMQIVTAALRR